MLIVCRHRDCPGATVPSADLTFSGNEQEYQDLAFSGRPIWLEWNDNLASTPASDLPPGLTPETKLFVPCGFLRLSNGPKLSEYDQECLEYLEQAGLRHHQHVIVSHLAYVETTCVSAGSAILSLWPDNPQKDEDDMKRLEEKEKADPETRWRTKIDAFKPLEEGKLDGFIDTSAGFTYADKVRRSRE
jgi:sarcosine oxidase/L-pipecolate oxidase